MLRPIMNGCMAIHNVILESSNGTRFDSGVSLESLAAAHTPIENIEIIKHPISGNAVLHTEAGDFMTIIPYED